MIVSIMERLCLIPTDLAYAAGLIDGEGCIGVYRRRDRGPAAYCGVIKVEMCQVQGIDFLHELFGGYRNASRPKDPKHNVLHEWGCAAKIASDCARLILPYLRVKKRQAQNLIEMHEIVIKIRASTSAQRKLRNGFMGHSGPFQVDEWLSNRANQIYEAQRKLNQRGLAA